MKLKASLIIDFDSTLVKEETLELVAETALRFNRRKKEFKKKFGLLPNKE